MQTKNRGAYLWRIGNEMEYFVPRTIVFVGKWDYPVRAFPLRETKFVKAYDVYIGSRDNFIKLIRSII